MGTLDIRSINKRGVALGVLALLLGLLPGCSQTPRKEGQTDTGKVRTGQTERPIPPTLSIGNPKAKARLEAFYPLDKKHQWLIDALHQAGEEYGDQLFIRAYDVTTDPGRKEQQKRGLKGTALLVNDKSSYPVGDKQVHFVGEPRDGTWKQEQFLAVLHHEVETANMDFSFKGTSGNSKKGVTLFMFSGAGLREPIEAVRAAFEKETGVSVRVCYAGSACLLAQIEITHRGDLYFPGETYYVDQAAKRGFIEGSRTLCYMIPVLMVPKGNPEGIHVLADLAKPGLKIGIGEPRSCAIGKTSEQLLKKHKLDGTVGKNVVLHTATAPELGNAMKIGSIDAAINWDAVAAWYADACDVIAIPPKDNLIVECPLAVLKFSKSDKAANQFLQFASSEKGKALFNEKRYTIDLKHPIYPFQTL